MPDIPTPGAALRSLLARDRIISVPGGGTPLEAHCAAATGFEAFYLSGYAIAAWRHGVPDVGLTGISDVVAAVTAVTGTCGLPVLVDADTGYGDAAAVGATVRRLEAAGAAAIQVEDQVWPKRCGHLAGKEVIPAADMERKVRAAVRSRQDPATVIIARTDAVAPHGLDEAIDRCRRYADAGADALFVDAPESREHLERIGAALELPLLVNLTESGRTPLLPLPELEAMGYRLALFPTAALRLAARDVLDLYAGIAATGGTHASAGRMLSLTELNALVGQDAVDALERDVLEQPEGLLAQAGPGR